jgi:Tol biopolymer transport system component
MELPASQNPSLSSQSMGSAMNKKLSTQLLLIIFIFTVAIISSAAEMKSYEVSTPVSAPRIFGEGVISTGDYDTHPAFSLDGNTLVFVKMAPDLSKWTIFVSKYVGGKWSEPEIPSFSGQYWDADPYFSKDGKTLYFISNRPVNEGQAMKDFDIWKVDFDEGSWGKPTRLSPPINSDSSEYYPTFTDDGTIYFGSRRKGGKGASDIYRSRLENGEYRTAENLGGSINTEGNEFEPFIAFDESFLIFMATPTESLDQGDFFISYNQNGNWTKAVKLPVPFNSDVTEFSPKVTRDGKYFFFSSNRNTHSGVFTKPETAAEMVKRIREPGNGLADIYQVDFSALQNALKK